MEEGNLEETNKGEANSIGIVFSPGIKLKGPNSGVTADRRAGFWAIDLSCGSKFGFTVVIRIGYLREFQRLTRINGSPRIIAAESNDTN